MKVNVESIFLKVFFQNILKYMMQLFTEITVPVLMWFSQQNRLLYILFTHWLFYFDLFVQ